MTISGDGSMLVASTSAHAVFLDVAKLTSAQADPLLGAIGDRMFSVNNNFPVITPDDKYVFVSHGSTAWLSVIEIAKARATKFSNKAIVGGMHTGDVNLPVASPNGRYLYVPNASVSDDLNWPGVCRGAGAPKGLVPSGAILVLDLHRIGPDLSKSVVATIPAGCSSRRLAVSPDNNTLYATATFDSMLWAFDVKPLKSGGTPKLIGKVPTGSSPIGAALIHKGKQIVVANTNLLPNSDNATAPGEQTLTVIETARISEGIRAALGTIPTNAVPRNPTVTADGKTLVVPRHSSSLDIIDLSRVKVEPRAK